MKVIIKIINFIFWKGLTRIEKILSYLPFHLLKIALRLIEINLNHKIIKMRLINLLNVYVIRKKDKYYLSSAKNLEFDLLPKLGLNDESLEVFPKNLYPFCGKGLLSWQYPNQFSKYLSKLSKLKLETYLEIGTHYGGTFIITVEYLNKFHPIRDATGIDISHFPFLSLYQKFNPNIKYMQMDSQSKEFKEFIHNHPTFDLVLIDGDHEAKGCKNDFEIVKDKANVIVFHDIVDYGWPGVTEVWNEVKIKYSGEYYFFEFVDQYKSVTERIGKSFIGIGMAIKKTYLQ